MSTTQGIIRAAECLVLVKVETTYGVDATPVITDARVVQDFKLEPQIETIARKRTKARFPSAGTIIGSIHWKFSFKCPAVGAGDPGENAAYGVPNWDPFLRAAQHSLTTTDEDSNTYDDQHVYTPDTTSVVSLTLYIVRFRDDGTQHLVKVTGAKVGSVKISAKEGEPATLHVEGLGLYEEDPSVPGTAYVIADVVYVADDDDAACKGLTVTYAGSNVPCSMIEISSNRKVVARSNITTGGKEGIGGIHHEAGDSVQLKWDREMRIQSTYDHWAKLKAEETGALVVQWDSAQGSRVKIDAPACQPAEFDYDDDEGMIRLGQTATLNNADPAGDDEYSITVTRTPP